MTASPLPRPSERGVDRRRRSTRAAARAGRRSGAPQDLAWAGTLAPIAIAGAMALFGWGHFTAPRPTGAGLIAIAVLCALAAPILRRQARPDDRFDVVGVMWLALGTKFALTYLRLLGGVDSVSYDREGARLADAFRSFDFTAPTGSSIPGTGTVRYVTGLVHVLTNTSYAATFLVFSFVGFLGLVLFYRAFVTAFPNGNTKRYALLVLFWPSLLFWPSSIGKESLVVFGLGLTSLGAARVFTRRPGGMVFLLVGLTAVAMVRPHVALIVVTAVLVGVVFRAPIGDSLTGLATKVVFIGVLLVAGVVVAGATESLLGLDDLSGSGAVSSALDETQRRTAQGGGEFAPARADSPADYPWSVTTVLLRPFLVEAGGFFGVLTALESMALLALLVWSAPTVAAHLARLRRSPYLVYALCYILTFCYLFSAIANFGILTRQRVQVLPMVMVLLALPAVAPSVPTRGRHRDREGHQ